MDRDRLEEGKMRDEGIFFCFFLIPFGKLSVMGVIYQMRVIQGGGVDLAGKGGKVEKCELD